MKTFIQHRQAKQKFQKLDTYEAGIELYGFEVKSIKNGQGSLEGSYAIVRDGEVFLVNATVPPWQPANTPKTYESDRPRRLLLSKKEIAKLAEAESQSGLTLVPFSLYNKNGRIKVALAVARNKNQRDKREDIKKRDTDRELRRSLKR